MGKRKGKGTSNTDIVRCAKGRSEEGPFCEVCNEGWYNLKAGGGCKNCTSPRADVLVLQIIFLVCLVFILLLGITMLLWKNFRARAQSWCQVNASRANIYTSYIDLKMKLFIFVFQKCNILHALEGSTISAFQASGFDSLEELRDFISLGFLNPRQFARCHLRLDYFGTYILLLAMVWFWTVLAVGAAGFARASKMHAFLLFWNLSIVELTSYTSHIFSCDERLRKLGAGPAYLLQDYRVQCYTQEHTVYKWLAATVAITWCAGVPLVLFFRMWHCRKHLDPPLEYNHPEAQAVDLQGQPQAQVHDQLSSSSDATPSHSLGGSDGRSETDTAFESGGQATKFLEDVLHKARARTLKKIHQEGTKIWTHTADGLLVEWDGNEELPETVQQSIIRLPHYHQYQDLLKIGLQAVHELENPELGWYKYLYQRCVPRCWWWEHVNLLGRMCYGFLPWCPANYQVRVGVFLSILLVAAAGQLRPYRRSSDSWMMIISNICVAVYFMLNGRNVEMMKQTDSRAEVLIEGICLSLPMLLMLYYTISTYVLSSGYKTLAKEEFSRIFIIQFCESWDAFRFGETSRSANDPEVSGIEEREKT